MELISMLALCFWFSCFIASVSFVFMVLILNIWDNYQKTTEQQLEELEAAVDELKYEVGLVFLPTFEKLLNYLVELSEKGEKCTS